MSDQDIKTIMKDIENKSTNMVAVALQSGIPSSKQSINILENIGRSVCNEFKEKVGREPTYSEMRAMWG
jgi:hypothetical protein